MKTMYVCILSTIFMVTSCSEKDEEAPANTRTYKMGFQNSAPRYDDFELILESLNLWTARADAAIIVTEVPWDIYLSGESFVDYVATNYVDLVSFYRSKGLELYVYIDPQNGLDRTSDAVALVNADRSITETEIQNAYERFVVVMDSMLLPEHIGLALETNLIRAASSSAMYNAVKDAANNAAATLHARSSQAKLSISIQADLAWGKLGGGSYTGAEQDFTDFPFMEEVGISSYPYFGFDKPEDIPVDYYSRLLNGRALPAFVSESGWPSEAVPNISFERNEDLQRRYVLHQHHLLSNINATAYFQLPFTDIDLSAAPPDFPPNLVYFTSLGMVTIDMTPKLALGAWDELFGRQWVSE